jgi:hypothetical protein
MRKTILTLALVATASPVFAQAAQQAKDNDPTHKVAGGISAAGWTGRLDPQAERRGMKIEDAKFSAMGSGYHITSGPALERAATRRWLGARLDPVFLPRDFIRLDRLPRSDTGKLRLESLHLAYSSWQAAARAQRRKRSAASRERAAA